MNNDAGNWKKFPSFAWFDQPEDADDWAIFYTCNRDSTLLEISNHEAITKIMEPFLEGEDVREESHNHWAVGHVDGFAIRVIKDGKETEAYLKWLEIQDKLESYPILDDDDYYTKELEATLENIKDVGRNLIKENVPDDWWHDVHDWFWENNQSAIENRDDQGGYPSDKQMEVALKALGYWDEND